MPSEPQTESGRADEDIAHLFHDTYERLAPRFGYQTRRESAVPWRDVPPRNRALMVETIHEVRHAIEQEAASKAVADERERLLGNLREFLKIHGDPLPWADVEAVFA